MSSTTQAKPAPVKTSPAHPPLRIYNTLSKRNEPFATVEAGKVGIYLCGPTVYDKAHIGHMVGPVIFDCIKRYLTYCGFKVNWVVNITGFTPMFSRRFLKYDSLMQHRTIPSQGLAAFTVGGTISPSIRTLWPM